jgi:4'-phosphopantetheinyl transferase
MSGIRIYSTEYKTQPSPESFQKLIKKLPVDFQEKIGKYKRWQDACGSLYGKFLLQIMLKECGFSADLGNLRYSKYQKPYLEDGPPFNISHSANRVACIMGRDGRVGIDLEEIREMPFADFQSQFSGEEWAAIQGAVDPTNTFYAYWTAKESIIKADGRGLQIPLKELHIDDSGTILFDGNAWNLRRLDWYDDYSCHIAFEEFEEVETTIHHKEITPDEIAGLFA